jgi:hypothetical protein
VAPEGMVSVSQWSRSDGLCVKLSEFGTTRLLLCALESKIKGAEVLGWFCNARLCHCFYQFGFCQRHIAWHRVKGGAGQGGHQEEAGQIGAAGKPGKQEPGQPAGTIGRLQHPPPPAGCDHRIPRRPLHLAAEHDAGGRGGSAVTTILRRIGARRCVFRLGRGPRGSPPGERLRRGGGAWAQAPRETGRRRNGIRPLAAAPVASEAQGCSQDTPLPWPLLRCQYQDCSR